MSVDDSSGRENQISHVEIILLHHIQADVAVRRKWIRREDVPRAEAHFVERRSHGLRTDLAESIAEISKLSQTDLDELRRLALVESMEMKAIADRRQEAQSGAPTIPAAREDSPTRTRPAWSRWVLPAGLLCAIGVLATALFLSRGPASEGGGEALAGTKPPPAAGGAPSSPLAGGKGVDGVRDTSEERGAQVAPQDGGAAKATSPASASRSDPAPGPDGGEPRTGPEEDPQVAEERAKADATIRQLLAGDPIEGAGGAAEDGPRTPTEPLTPEEFLRVLQGER